jgi:hypothetical protein
MTPLPVHGNSTDAGASGDSGSRMSIDHVTADDPTMTAASQLSPAVAVAPARSSPHTDAATRSDDDSAPLADASRQVSHDLMHTDDEETQHPPDDGRIVQDEDVANQSAAGDDAPATHEQPVWAQRKKRRRIEDDSDEVNTGDEGEEASQQIRTAVDQITSTVSKVAYPKSAIQPNHVDLTEAKGQEEEVITESTAAAETSANPVHTDAVESTSDSASIVALLDAAQPLGCQAEADILGAAACMRHPSIDLVSDTSRQSDGCGICRLAGPVSLTIVLRHDVDGSYRMRRHRRRVIQLQ